MPKYVHFPINEEIRGIGGYYKVLEEGVIDFEDKKVLYALKGAHFDSSCCTVRGVGMVAIAGYLASWKSAQNENGFPVSEVKHINDTESRKQIKALLKKRFPYIEVFDFD
ncbi:MAG TPA: hypothetical protein VIK22_11850 [Candidatus Anoxymicrobiaceae bacterium]|jgi:hypothetical protein